MAGAALLLYLGIHLVKGQQPTGSLVDLALAAAFILGLVLWAWNSEPVQAALPRNRPKLLAEEPKMGTGIVFTRKVDHKDRPIAFDIASIDVYNDRVGGPAARGVVATVEARNEAGELVSRTHGNWQGVPEPDWPREGGNKMPAQKACIEATGERHELCLVIRNGYYPIQTPDCWLAAPMLKLSDSFGGKRLKPGRYKIDVILRGDFRGKPHFKYELTVPEGLAPDVQMELQPR
jgi:hypothetical protein